MVFGGSVGLSMVGVRVCIWDYLWAVSVWGRDYGGDPRTCVFGGCSWGLWFYQSFYGVSVTVFIGSVWGGCTCLYRVLVCLEGMFGRVSLSGVSRMFVCACWGGGHGVYRGLFMGLSMSRKGCSSPLITEPCGGGEGLSQQGPLPAGMVAPSIHRSQRD